MNDLGDMVGDFGAVGTMGLTMLEEGGNYNTKIS